MQNFERQSQLDALLNENKKLKMHLESSEKSNDELRQLLVKLQLQFDEQTTLYKTKTEQMIKGHCIDLNETDLLREKLLKMEIENSISEKVNQTLLENICCLERSLDHLRREQTGVQLDNARQRVKHLEREIQLFVDFIDKLQIICFPESSPMSVRDSELQQISESALDEVFLRLEKTEKQIQRINELEDSLKSLETEKSVLVEKLERRNNEEETKSYIKKQQMEKLEEDLRRKDKEMNETVDTFDKILISAEERHHARTVKMEGVIAEKDNKVKCLKTDLEVMSASYKRIKILMEEHLDELACLKEINEMLKSKIGSELTLQKKDEFESEIRKLKAELTTAKEDQLVVQSKFSEKLEKVNEMLEILEEENGSLCSQVSQLCRDRENDRAAFREKEEGWQKLKMDYEFKLQHYKDLFNQLSSYGRSINSLWTVMA